jgi:hypothetical protein
VSKISMCFAEGTKLSFYYQGGTKPYRYRQVVVEKCDDVKQLLTGKEDGSFKSFHYSKMVNVIVMSFPPCATKLTFDIDRQKGSVGICIYKDSLLLCILRFYNDGNFTINGDEEVGEKAFTKIVEIVDELV